MKKHIVAAACALLAAFSSAGSYAKEPVWLGIDRGRQDLRTVLVDAGNPRVIYFGTGDAVFKTEDGAESWQSILTLSGQNKAVNLLFFDLEHKNALYAATSAGLFCSFNQGKNWRRIFRVKNYSESDCTALAILPKGFYLGTKAGLFLSRDKGRSWYKEKSILSNSHILAIAYDAREPDYLYVACANGVFKSENGGESWERVFVSSPVENGAEVRQDSPGDQDEEGRISEIRHIAVNPQNLNCLYLATSRGVYQTKDKGKSWELLTSFGLLSQDIRFVLVLPGGGGLYVTTKSALFVFNNERWQELSLRLAAGEIRFLACDSQGDLYVACDKGLFKMVMDYGDSYQDKKTAEAYSEEELDIRQVQQAAIRYAEVEPEKIKKWRQQAAHKALLPAVNVGIDRDTGELWHWESGSSTKPEDDVLRRGRDSIGWDVSLSWDLGELIWNQDQTSIDVRSRLMVELRDDILDEVTKLYFERLRVKAELDSLSIEERKKRFEKDLRLRELTANLDALTGGYFSEQISHFKTGS
jgi:photosystem II stability/assembly factor-like uncharacterized protein